MQKTQDAISVAGRNTSNTKTKSNVYNYKEDCNFLQPSFFALPFGIGNVTREQSLIFLHKKRGLLSQETSIKINSMRSN